MKLTRRDRIVLLTPLALLLLAGLVGPALIGLVATVTTYSPFGTKVEFAGLQNYLTVLQDPQFLPSLRNIVVFTLVAVPLELLIGFGLAYVLREPIAGRPVWRVLLLLPWLISPIANGVMWHFLFGSATGIADFVGAWFGQSEVASPIGDLRLALPATIAVEVWRIAPFVTFLLLPSLSSVPAERWEEASLAGASTANRILRIAVPAVRPVLLTIAMLLIGLSLGTFDTVLILTGGGPGTATLTPALYSYAQAFQINDWPAGAAAGWLIAAGVLAVGAVYLRLARRGVEE